jgi:Na+-transporting methylmalonyl-CoA/oxaloacetate decarboxylase gamma subunit
MCGPWWCHSWIFGFGVELLIFSLLVGFGAFVSALVCRIWGDANEEASTANRSTTAEEHTIDKAA